MAKLFGKEDLLDVFRRVGAAVGREASVFLLGGGAMCFRNQKPGTKDLDLVFLDGKDADEFSKCAVKIGFSRPKSLELEYKLMGACNILENANEFRLDIFCETVCGALNLSKSMAKRAEQFGKFGKLTVLLVSNEDVVLFKAITQRPRDVEDIVAVVRGANVNWNIVLSECKAQSLEHKWYGLVYNKLVEIEEKHGVSAPIMDALLKLDRKTILEEAYSSMRGKGMGSGKALAELKKMGFTEKELGHLERKS